MRRPPAAVAVGGLEGPSSASPLLGERRGDGANRARNADSDGDDGGDGGDGGGDDGWDPTLVTLAALGLGLAIICIVTAVFVFHSGGHSTIDKSFVHLVNWLADANVLVSFAIIVPLMTVGNTAAYRALPIDRRLARPTRLTP